MNNTQLVDLLLVRLSREEEKQQVLELLISELGLSIDEARQKVDSSPSILCEGIAMEQGRILQSRMYPFVDILPRIYMTDSATKHPKADLSESETTEDSIQDNDSEHPEENVDNQNSDSEQEETEASLDDDALIITSAAEEMLSVERCHICGRTPTSTNKLIPCRTCGELTCSSCFDRKKHVCHKCVSEGKFVDRPLERASEDIWQHEQNRTREPEISNLRRYRSMKKDTSFFSGLSPVVIGITALVAIIVAFFLIDPLNLFNGKIQNGSESELILSSADSIVSESSPEDSIGTDSVSGLHSDTSMTDNLSDTLTVGQIDSIIAVEDNMTSAAIEGSGVISLRNITIPDRLNMPEEITVPRLLLSTPVRSIEIVRDSLPLLSYPVGYIAAATSVELDAISLIQTDDGYNIFIMSILHPEPAERRSALISNLGSLFDSTIVDQMVLYYRENEYYEPSLFSFISDSFSVITQSNSPYFIQRKQGAIPETSDLVSGKIFEWMINLN